MSKSPGPVAKRDSQRRRRNTPASYGAAEPEVADVPAAPPPRELAIDNPHELIVALWGALQESAEARYYSVADWQRVRLELHYGNTLLQAARPLGHRPRRPALRAAERAVLACGGVSVKV